MAPMRFSINFYRTAAVCSVISAATTLMLIFLPSFFAPAEGFDGRMARVHDPAYQLRSWVYLVHPFITLMAALAVATRVRNFKPGLAVVGMLAMTLWAFTEAAQQGMTLFAFDKWRVAYATADEATRAQIRTLTMMYDGLWDGMYFVLLIAFAIGNLCLGLELLHFSGLGRVVGGFFIAASLLTVSLIWREIGWGELPEPLASWSYPAIQPLGRTLIGVWLWRVADESLPLAPRQ
jgi:hypothetical protein